MITDLRVDATLWLQPEDLDQLRGGGFEGEKIDLEVERTDRNEVAFHTFIDGKGSYLSIYLNREDAIEVARRLLNEARPDWQGPGRG